MWFSKKLLVFCGIYDVISTSENILCNQEPNIYLASHYLMFFRDFSQALLVFGNLATPIVTNTFMDQILEMCQ